MFFCILLAPGPVGGSTNSADSQNVIIAVSVSSGVAVIGLVIVMITCFARRKRQAREMLDKLLCMQSIYDISLGEYLFA